MVGTVVLGFQLYYLSEGFQSPDSWENLNMDEATVLA